MADHPSYEFQAVDEAEAEERRKQQQRQSRHDYEDEDEDNVRVPIPDEPIQPAGRTARDPFNGDLPEGVRELPVPDEPINGNGTAAAPGKTEPLALTYFDGCAGFVEKREIIKSVIAIGETSGWVGPPGSAKSALLTEISVHCAAQREWRGHKAKQACGIVIFALERADLFRRRLHAYQLRDNLHGLPIAVASAVIDLLNPACVDLMVATVREAERQFSCAVGLIVIDTYAKGIAANGGDEDKARDQNRAAANLRKVHAEIDVHIALVGHTGKDETRGARGSNAHLGDVDLMVQINSDTAIKVAEIVKANDAALGVIAQFKLEVFEFGRDSDGDPITTAILAAEQYDVGRAAKKKPSLAAVPKAALRSLFECIADGHTMPVPNDPHIPKSVTSGTSLSHWRCDALSRGILNADGNPREQFRRIRVTLINAGFIGVWEDFVWPVT